MATRALGGPAATGPGGCRRERAGTIGARSACSAAWSETPGWQLGLWRRDELVPIPDGPVHAEQVRMLARWFMRVLPPGPSVSTGLFRPVRGAGDLDPGKPTGFPDLGWLNESLRAEELAANGPGGLAVAPASGCWPALVRQERLAAAVRAAPAFYGMRPD
ncbi:MAG: hypothetical protein MZV65_47525 [Chromatiales bacterium]|nr:hypothetical protein [Chromatiales bacterium]